MIEHTMRNFDADLQERASKIAEMGRLDDEQIALATDALVKGNDALAQRVNIAETGLYGAKAAARGRAPKGRSRQQGGVTVVGVT